MKAELIQIFWHSKQAIYSIDTCYDRFATCGGDEKIRVYVSLIPGMGIRWR